MPRRGRPVLHRGGAGRARDRRGQQAGPGDRHPGAGRAAAVLARTGGRGRGARRHLGELRGGAAPGAGAGARKGAPGRWRRRGGVSVEVPDTATALLIVDGAFEKLLGPGLHAFWKYQGVIKVEQADRRVQAMEVTGQEILARDKVSLRVNLTALWQVEDVVRARSSVTDVTDSVYKTLQFALRAAVGGRTLDELLADKTLLDREILADVVSGLAVLVVAVRSVGVKDAILTGEMKAILNQVVE